jgi:hypothetical protein
VNDALAGAYISLLVLDCAVRMKHPCSVPRTTTLAVSDVDLLVNTSVLGNGAASDTGSEVCVAVHRVGRSISAIVTLTAGGASRETVNGCSGRALPGAYCEIDGGGSTYWMDLQQAVVIAAAESRASARGMLCVDRSVV